MRAASAGSWVTITKAAPWRRLRSRIRSKTCAAFSRSRLPVGSSASTHAGWVTSARATATRWRSPPGKLARAVARRDARGPPRPASPRRARAPRVCGARRMSERHRHVLERGELRQQVVELVDEAEGVVAQPPCAARHRATTGRWPSSVTAPGAGTVEAAQQVQQRALARARGADDGHRFAARHLEVDAPQHGHRDVAQAEGLGERLAG